MIHYYVFPDCMSITRKTMIVYYKIIKMGIKGKQSFNTLISKSVLVLKNIHTHIRFYDKMANKLYAVF